MIPTGLILLAFCTSEPLPDTSAASEAPRAGLATQDAEDASPAPAWTGSFSAGATFTSGNTDTTSVAVGADAVRETDANRQTLRGWWNYAEQEDVLTDRTVGATYKYDHFVDERLYYLGIAGLESNELSGLDLRHYFGGGAGYKFHDTEKFQFDGEAALTYITEKYEVGKDADYLAARLAYNLGYQYSDTTRFEQIAEVFPSLEDSDDFNGKLDSRVRVDVSSSMFFQLQWVFDYDNTPARGAEKDDHRVIVGVGWQF